jgi:hypothetical protein
MKQGIFSFSFNITVGGQHLSLKFKLDRQEVNHPTGDQTGQLPTWVDKVDAIFNRLS